MNGLKMRGIETLGAKGGETGGGGIADCGDLAQGEAVDIVEFEGDPVAIDQGAQGWRELFRSVPEGIGSTGGGTLGVGW